MSEEKIEHISEFVDVSLIELKNTPCPCMVHLPTNKILKIWSVVEGMEEGFWEAAVGYAKKAVQLTMVNWPTDDLDFLFPCGSFIERYMDPVGSGEKTVDEVSAELMAKIMVKSWENKDG